MGFLKDVDRAKPHEQKVIQHLLSLGNIVIDTTENPDYYELDIDCEVNFWNGEIKCDFLMYKSQNIYVEYISSQRKNTQGWYYKSTADIIYYYDAINEIIYSIDFQDLREYVETNKQILKSVSGGDDSRGYIININRIKELPHTTIYNINGE